MVAEKCVDPTSQRPYPVGMIEKGMTEVGFSAKIGKSAKSQVRTIQYSYPDASRYSTGKKTINRFLSA